MEYQYLIKKLGSQEMGSRASREGKCSRGRYLLIPKIASELFPTLSNERENDCAFIGVNPVYRTRDGGCFPKCYLDFVYHNSKVVYQQKNGRNEQRIYLNRKLDEGEFFGGDIVVMRRLSDLEMLSAQDERETVSSEETEVFEDETVSRKAGYEYYVDWIRPDIQCDEWHIYDRWIEGSSERRGATSAVICGRIDMFESKVARACPSGLVVDEKIVKTFADIGKESETGGEDAGLSGLDSYAEFFNRRSFRDFVLTSYGNTCAVTNEAICFGSLNNLEAAHIHPRYHGGSYLPQNGIAMRSDIHWAFDRGMFYIDPDTLAVHVHPLLKDSYLGRYEGRIVRPKTPQFAPHPEFLKYHRAYVYGSFQKTGS